VLVVPDRTPKNQASPQDVLESILSAKGMDAIGYCYDQLHDAFFVATNDEEIQA
jgi:hypothetical protein